MAERAHPEDSGFKNQWFGLKKNHYRKKLYERYGFCVQYVKGKKILDIPCGVGWGTSLLSGAAYSIGVDISQDAVAYARKHYEKDNRKFQVGRMEEIPLKNDTIEVVICLEGFEHVAKDVGAEFIKESKRVLEPNGLLVMTCPILNEQGESTGNPYHLYEYPENELIEILNDNFRILRLERHSGPNGPEYTAVVQNNV